MSNNNFLNNGEVTISSVEAEIEANFPNLNTIKTSDIRQLIQVKQRLQSIIYQTNDMGNASAQTTTSGTAESNISYCEQKINQALDERAKQAEKQIKKIDEKTEQIAKRSSFSDFFNLYNSADPVLVKSIDNIEGEKQKSLDILEKPLWDFISDENEKLKLLYCFKMLSIIEDGEKYIDDSIELIEFCQPPFVVVGDIPNPYEKCIGKAAREDALPKVLQQQKDALSNFNSFSANSEVPEAFKNLTAEEKKTWKSFIPFVGAYSDYSMAGYEQELGNTGGMQKHAESAGVSLVLDSVPLGGTGGIVKGGKALFNAGKSAFKNGAKGIASGALKQRVQELAKVAGSSIKRSGEKVANFFRKKCARGCK